MAPLKSYDTRRTQTEVAIQYHFVSRGKVDIIKVIEYQYIGDFLGYPLYNLGFGDYDSFTDSVIDESNSNNGDIYPIFHTVLSTIPDFFEIFPGAMLMVKGSDSTPEFEENCKKDCNRKCADKCKKLNRRINIYTGYVNKNLDALRKEYVLKGTLYTTNRMLIVEYEMNKKYSSVFLRKK